MKLILLFLGLFVFTYTESGPVPQLTYLEPWSYNNYGPMNPNFARQIQYDEEEEEADDEEGEDEDEDDADDDAHDEVYPESGSNVFPKYDGTEKDSTTINEYQKHFPTSFSRRAGKPNRSKSKQRKPKPEPVETSSSIESDEASKDYGNIPWMSRERSYGPGPVARSRHPGGQLLPRRRMSSSNLLNARSAMPGGLFSRRVIPGIIPDQGIKVYYYNNGYGRGRGFY